VAASAKLRDAAATEPHASLADAFAALSDTLAGIEEAREQLLRRRAQEKVLQPLRGEGAAAPARCARAALIAPMRRLLGDRKARLKAMAAADADFSAAAAAGQQLQQQQLQQGAGGGGGAAAAAVGAKDRRRKNSLFEKKSSSAPAGGDPAAAARAGATKASEKFWRLLDEQEAARNVGALLRAAGAFAAGRGGARTHGVPLPRAGAAHAGGGGAGEAVAAAGERGEAEAVAALEKQLASLCPCPSGK
jgi:hypothetical protein